MTWLTLLIVAGLVVLFVAVDLAGRARNQIRARRVQSGVPAEQPDRRAR